jgi:hypothetical protein
MIDKNPAPSTQSMAAIDNETTVFVRDLDLAVGPIAQVDSAIGRGNSFIGGLFTLKVQPINDGPEAELQPLSLVMPGAMLLALSRTLSEYGPSLVGTMLMRHELGATLHTELGDIPLNVPSHTHNPTDPDCVMHEDEDQADEPEGKSFPVHTRPDGTVFVGDEDPKAE